MTGCDREPHLHVFAERAMWRWSYHDPAFGNGAGLHLRGAIAFPEVEEARSSATTAYPGIPIAEDQDEQSHEASDGGDPPKKHRCRRTVPAALAAAVLVATAVIILRQRAVDDHGPGRPERAGLRIEFGPGFRIRFPRRRPGVSAATRGSPARWSEDVIMVDLTKCSAALPRSSRARRVGGRR